MKQLLAIGFLGFVWLTVIPRTAAWQGGQVTSVTLAPGSPVATGTAVAARVTVRPVCETVEINFGDGFVHTLPVAQLPMNHTYTNPGSFTVTARGQGNCRGVASAPMVVNPRAPGPDLNPDLSGSPLTATAGQDLTYVLRLQNAGTVDAVNVKVRSRLPRETDFVRVEGDPWTCSQSGQAGAEGGVYVICSINRLTAGDSDMIRIVTRPIRGLADNIQILFGVTVDPDNTIAESSETNNGASVITTLRSPADLAITSIVVEKTNPPGPPPAPPPGGRALCGVNTRVRVHIVNNGPGGSPPTTIGMNWSSGVARGDRDCGLGDRCGDTGECAPNTSGAACFESCAVPALFPGTSADIVFRINRDQELSSFGSATVDPTPSAVNDPNRGNNVRTIQ